MREQVISIILAVVIYSIGQILNLSNATLNFLFQFIPVLILACVIWKNNPKTYLKIIAFTKKDIKYIYTVKITECELKEENFKNIQLMLLNAYERYQGTTKKIINTNNDDYILSSVIKVDTTFIELTYHKIEKCLYLELDNSITYRQFIDRIKLINDKFMQSLASIKFGDTFIQLKIEFLSLEKEECRNPFILKYFKDFNNRVVNIHYVTKRGTKIDITNNTIELISNSINDLDNDITDELTIFRLKIW